MVLTNRNGLKDHIADLNVKENGPEGTSLIPEGTSLLPKGYSLSWLAKIPIKRTVHWPFFINSTFDKDSTNIFDIVSNPLCTVHLIGMFKIFSNSTLNRTVRLIGCVE